MLDFSLTEEQKALRKLAHKFAETEMRPVATDIDRNPNPDKSFPWEVIRKAFKLGFGTLLVPAESPGLKIGKIEDKMGMRSGSQGEIFFEEVRVPMENMLGEENGAFRVVNETFRGNAVGVSSEALGLARAAYEIALQYANERTSWGKLIRQYESTMDMPVQMRVKIEAARAFIWKMAWSIEHPDQSQGLDNLASMIKLFASQLVREVTVDALQILGGYGYMKDFPVEKYVRDAMVTTIRDLTSEFIMIGLAQKL